MPRPLPPEDEAKIEELYLDETSQTGHRFLIFGGLSVPLRYSKQLEEASLEARGARLSAVREGEDHPRELKWKDVTKGDYGPYRDVVDAYFDFAKNGNSEFHCSVVLTHVKGRAFSGARGKKGFDNEVFQHCLKMAIYHKTNLFHVYLDRRHSADEEAAAHDSKLRKKICSLLKHNDDERAYAVRRVKSRHSREVQALQITDLLLGAVAFRLNRHYGAAGANPDKRQLCEHVLRRGGVWDCFNDERGTFRPKKVGRFQIWMQRPTEAKKNPPPKKKAIPAASPEVNGAV